MQCKLQDRYVAGLWLEDLPRGLAWYIPYYGWEGEVPRGHFPLSHVASSWSWASTEQGVLSLNYGYVDCKLSRDGLEILDATVEVPGCDPFGQVKAAVLKVCGRLREFLVRKLPDLRRQSLFLCSPESKEVLHGQYHPDEPYMASFPLSTKTMLETQDQSQSEKLVRFLYLGQFSLAGEPDQWAALAIESIPGRVKQYRRLGLALCPFKLFPGSEHIFNDAEQKAIEII